MKDKNSNKYKELDEINPKAQEQAGCDTQSQTPTSWNISSPAEELRQNANRMSESANKQWAGAIFLEQHPEFNEFILLIRKGSIHI